MIWTRKNVPAGSDLFGDQEMLFVVPPDGSPALVLSAINGELLGRRSVPPLDRRMATVGRSLLVWTSEEGMQTLALQDPWHDDARRVLWSRKFVPGSKACVVGQEAVGVLEPGGAFVLLALPDGKPIVQEALEPENALNSIYVLRSAEGYLLVTNSLPQRAQTVAAAPGGPQNDPLINGRVYAFSRETGKKLWHNPAVIDQNGLVLTQPSELPVLVFMGHATLGGQGTRAIVLCIDKRTGATVYRNDALPLSINNFELIADPDKATVSLVLPGKRIVLRFTDEPPVGWLDRIRNSISGTGPGGALGGPKAIAKRQAQAVEGEQKPPAGVPVQPTARQARRVEFGDPFKELCRE